MKMIMKKMMRKIRMRMKMGKRIKRIKRTKIRKIKKMKIMIKIIKIKIRTKQKQYQISKIQKKTFQFLTKINL